MTVRTICLATLVLIAGAHTASAMTGMDLYNRCGNGFKAGFVHRDECHSFVVGVAAGLANTGQICFRGQLNGQQATMIVQAYMRNHPENLGAPAGTIVTQALMQAYPCGQL